MRRVLALGAAIFATVLGGCGGGAGPADGAVDAEVIAAVAVDTSAPTSVRAGQTVMVTCLLIDANGEEFTAPPSLSRTLRVVPEDSLERQADGSWIAVRTGSVEVACTFSALRLTDETPAVVEVLPGAPVRVVTHVAPDSIPAGAETVVSCEVFDAWGNVVADTAPTTRAEPSDEANTFDEPYARFVHAGRFEVFCDLPGADSRGATLEVYPNVPASLLIAKVPEQPVYALGQVIEIERLVHDRLGNLITDVEVPVTSVAHPANANPRYHGQALGDGRFRYQEEGRYTVTATVTPPTEGDIPLTASTTIVVDSSGPALACDSPIDGGILHLAPFTSITFRGTVSDLSGVTSVRVNGAATPVAPDGTFSITMRPEYGINFVDLSAVDGTGQEASRTCAFLVADVWAPDTTTFSDTLSLRLRQAAFDDASRSGALNSLADVLHTVLNSSGLRDTLHTSLRAANPLKPSACDSTVLGVCVLRSEVIYNNMEINGPNTTSLTLVEDGLRATVNIRNLRINIRVRGHVAGINYDTTGWVTFNSADVGVTFNPSISAGRPRVTVRPGSVSVTVGGISTNFSGLDGAIVDIVADLFEGTVRNMVRDLIRDWVTDNFDGILDGVLGGLDIDSLGTSFDVPRLDGGAPIPLQFGVGFSSLNTTSTRMLFGIATRFYAPPAHARTTLGAPVRAGARRLDVSGTNPAGVAVHEVVLNQALHALWRGGFLDATLGESAIPGAPAGISATLSTGLPPVAILRADKRVELQLGAMQMLLTYPELFSEPIRVSLGARASLAVTMSGEELAFSDLRIEALYFSTDIASLDMDTRDTIEGFLTRLLQRVAYSALEGALPAIPIPSFTLPASLSTYGLPAGAELGIVSPAFDTEAPHFVLRGGFAVR